MTRRWRTRRSATGAAIDDPLWPHAALGALRRDAVVQDRRREHMSGRAALPARSPPRCSSSASSSARPTGCISISSPGRPRRARPAVRRHRPGHPRGLWSAQAALRSIAPVAVHDVAQGLARLVVEQHLGEISHPAALVGNRRDMGRDKARLDIPERAWCGQGLDLEDIEACRRQRAVAQGRNDIGLDSDGRPAPR